MTSRDPQADPAVLKEGIERAAVTRRDFLKTLGVAAGAAGVASSTGCGSDWQKYFRQHYKELTDADKREIVAQLEADARAQYGVDIEIRDPRPLDGVAFGYALNVGVCIGCRRCEWACAEENNTSRDPEIHYIRVLEMEQGSFDVEHSNHTYEGEVPRPGKFYMPVQCHQCANPPCTRACPVQATWAEPDGVVVVDYDWCIGCRYCEAACPYFARRFNFAAPTIRPSEINPHQGYLTNRLRKVGIIEKCHFCLHRTREGRYPACLEVCPTGARKFGSMLDPGSEVRRVLDTKRVYVFKEDLGTHPRFFYFFG